MKPKQHISIIITSWLIGAFLLSFITDGSDMTLETLISSLSSYVSIFSFLIGYLLFLNSRFLNQFFSWKKHSGLRLAIGIFVSFLIILLGFNILLSIKYSNDFSIERSLIILKSNVIELSILAFIISLFYNVIYYAFYSYQSYVHLQVAGIKTEREQIKLQLQALKNQLSPHFLFNSLNTISSLIYKDDQQAEIFIRNLANAYKFTLASYDKKLITVEEELKFISAYQSLLRTRFGDDFVINIQTDAHINLTQIPPLTIQLLIENASKHNVINENNNVTVNILNDKNNIIIKNNKTKPTHNVESFKIGLKNITERYKLLKGKEIKIINSENIFEVQLPII